MDFPRILLLLFCTLIGVSLKKFFFLISKIERAATLIRNASLVFVTAGAGFGVDSGLPDFRGNEGFWNAYPAFRDVKTCAFPISRGFTWIFF